MDLLVGFELDEATLLLDDDLRLLDTVGCVEDCFIAPAVLESTSFSELESDRWFSVEIGLYGGIVLTLPPFF